MEKDSIALVGCLMGTAVGDALGLPMEGLSKRRQLQMFPDIGSYRFLFGRGMISDDTEHACMTAQALISARRDMLFDEKEFTASLGRRLRLWLLMLPAAAGYATLRAIMRLWLGFKKSGVYSAGNGPAMRSVIIGAAAGDDLDNMKSLVHLSTLLTHTDPKAYDGAVAVALAASMASKHIDNPGEYLRRLSALTDNRDFLAMIRAAADSVDLRTEDFAAAMGMANGVSGYIYHTVSIVLHAWFKHATDYKTAVTTAVRCGGDTDTVAAILGGIIGARVGKSGIPRQYIENLCEWPMTPGWIERLGMALSQRSKPDKPPEFSYVKKLLRNIAFLAVVMFHGLRRLFPPY